MTANGVAWSLAQTVLVTAAWIDLSGRAIPNVVVLPLSAAAIVACRAFVRGSVVEVTVAAVVAFAVFLRFAGAVRAGFGVGDVKLAAEEGAQLGRIAVGAPLLGVVLGGSQRSRSWPPAAPADRQRVRQGHTSWPPRRSRASPGTRRGSCGNGFQPGLQGA